MTPAKCSTNHTISLHGFVKHRCFPNLKESQFILPSCLRSFYGRHSINICYLKKMHASTKRNTAGKRIQFQNQEFVNSLLECNTLLMPRPPYPTEICLPVTYSCVISYSSSFQERQRWGYPPSLWARKRG